MTIEREEDYPGQNDEIRRHKIIEEAVEAADRIIMDGSNGSKEETNYLTAKVAEHFVDKMKWWFEFSLLRRDKDPPGA